MFVTTEVKRVWKENVELKGRVKVLEDQMGPVVGACEHMEEKKGMLEEGGVERKGCGWEGLPVDVMMGDGGGGVRRREKREGVKGSLVTPGNRESRLKKRRKGERGEKRGGEVYVSLQLPSESPRVGFCSAARTEEGIFEEQEEKRLGGMERRVWASVCLGMGRAVCCNSLN